MATKNNNFPLSFFLSIILVAYFVKEIKALEDSTKHHFHRVEITSLLPASVCSPSTIQGSTTKGQSRLEVTHQHGPCSQVTPTVEPPSFIEILSNDQSRVDSIQARIDRDPNTDIDIDGKKHKAKKVTLPVQSGQFLGSGNYIVKIGLGTPAKPMSLIFDTGSDLSWTQCKPCVRSCHEQQDPIFDPSASSSFSNVSCDTPQCLGLISATGTPPGCSKVSRRCIYGVEYGDLSFSVGFFSKDKLTLPPNEKFPNFLFGCGQDNEGFFGKIAGILGLGRDPLSIVSQTSKKYGKYFSYCLPGTISSRGHLTLGKSNVHSTNVTFTPFSTSRSNTFYYIDIVSISVGGRRLSIAQSVFVTAGSIVDSGTVITRLPPAAYAAMRDVYRTQMAKYPSAAPFSILDTCYDFSNYTTVTIPTIRFTFAGNATVQLVPQGTLVAVSPSRFCLAFAGNRNPTNLAIIGNTQQKTFEVVYDVEGGKLGFAPNGCY